MPVIPPVVQAPYDTAQYVLNLARAIANDAAFSIQGDLLNNDQPYTYVLLNQAWRTLQRQLANSGYETLIKEAILQNVIAVTQPNPATQIYINWTTFYNGTTNYDTPVLPQDCILPLRLWERQHGTQAQFVPMQQANDGLPSINQTNFLRLWDWRNDKIYMIGAMQDNDIRMRYAAYLADIGATPTAVVPIVRCADSLANYLVGVFARARGSPLADSFMAAGDKSVREMLTYTARKRQRGSHRRMPYGWQARWGYTTY